MKAVANVKLTIGGKVYKPGHQVDIPTRHQWIITQGLATPIRKKDDEVTE